MGRRSPIERRLLMLIDGITSDRIFIIGHHRSARCGDDVLLFSAAVCSTTEGQDPSGLTGKRNLCSSHRRQAGWMDKPPSAAASKAQAKLPSFHEDESSRTPLRCMPTAQISSV